MIFCPEKGNAVSPFIWSRSKEGIWYQLSVVWEANAISCFKILPSDVGKAKGLLCRHRVVPTPAGGWRQEAYSLPDRDDEGSSYVDIRGKNTPSQGNQDQGPKAGMCLGV